MAADSYLRLINLTIGEAIRNASPERCRAFALACAGLAIESLPGTIAVNNGTIDQHQLITLHLSARDASGSAAAPGIDALLRQQKDRLHAALGAFRPNNTSAPYSDYVRLDTWRHAVRALRAALAPDGTFAAGRAAYETICTTREDNRVIRLAEDLLIAH